MWRSSTRRRLRVVDVKTKAVTEIDQSPHFLNHVTPSMPLAWSADSRRSPGRGR
jgi:hypothetical protein